MLLLFLFEVSGSYYKFKVRDHAHDRPRDYNLLCVLWLTNHL